MATSGPGCRGAGQHREALRAQAIKTQAAGLSREQRRIATGLFREAGGPPDQMVEAVGRRDQAAGVEGLHHHPPIDAADAGGVAGPTVDRFTLQQQPVERLAPDPHPPAPGLVRLGHPAIDPERFGAEAGGALLKDHQVRRSRCRFRPQRRSGQGQEQGRDTGAREGGAPAARGGALGGTSRGGATGGAGGGAAEQGHSGGG